MTRDDMLMGALVAELKVGTELMRVSKQWVIDAFARRFPYEAPMTVEEAGATLVRASRTGRIDILDVGRDS